MFDGLKPYSAMKDSGIPWLGAVPQHWELERLKYLLREHDVRSCDGAEQLLRVSQYTGVTERKRDDGGDEPDTRAASLVGYKRVEPADLVVNIMLAWNGSMGVSPYSGIASPAYCVYRFGAKAVPWYYHHLLRSPIYKARIKAVSTGVVESRLRLYTDDLSRLEALLPPRQEQVAIVRFLDHADGRIRRYMRAKQKLIKLLEEQRQVIIHRAVTRGLDPNVRLKPSGVEWLGDVPEHWEVRRGKVIFACVDARSQAGAEQLLTVSSRDGVVPRAGRDITMFMAASYKGHKLCWPEDLVINSLWAWANGLGFATHHGIVSTAYGVYRLRPLYRSAWQYLHLALRSGAYDWQFHARSKGIWKSRLQLTDSAFLNMPIVVPPTNEAQAICERVAKDTAELQKTINTARREIDLLHEYRTRLIADVVTGKLDVREAAARLPDATDTTDAVDDSEISEEGEDASEDAELATVTEDADA